MLRTASLDPAQVAAVLVLADAAERADGHPPLSDHTRLHLSGDAGGHPSVHLLVEHEDRLVGYAHVGLAPEPEAELVVHPDARRRGTGGLLLAAALEAADGRLAVWAHGSVPGSTELAEHTGLKPARTLLRMARPSGPSLPQPRWAEGVTVRTYRPWDGPALLAVNARAFAHHPEQGRWTAADLALREAEPWFDPAGIFLAERDGRLLGFHWTKVHADGTGEVYVVGVDPGAQGLGLGRALTVVGVEHLARSCPLVTLYADDDNVAAVGLYRSLGFTVAAADVRWSTS